MILQELFDKDVKFKVIEKDKDYWVADYKLQNGVMLEFTASSISERWSGYPIWEIQFSVNDEYVKTVDVDSIEVFTVVSSMIRKFIKLYNPVHVYMTAKELNRAKMYTRLMNRLFSGWRFVQFKDDHDRNYVIAGVKNGEFPLAYDSVGVSPEHHVTPDGGNRFSGYNGQFDDEFRELEKGEET